MILIEPTSTSNTTRSISVFLRSNDVNEVIIIRESINKNVNPIIVDQTHSSGNASNISLSFSEDDLIEGELYSIKVKDSQGGIIYRDKLFATSQTDYSINDGQYQQYNSVDNEYITLD